MKTTKIRKNLLVTLADRNYVGQAKQLFSSVYWNAGWKGDYMLLAYKISENDLKWFKEKRILITNCKPIYSEKKLKGLYREYPTPTKKQYSLNCLNIILNKLYLFAPEFKKWKNIIFLDTDIIVRASLDDLIEIKGFAAVTDSTPKLKDQFINPKRNKVLFNKLKKKYNLNEKAFNSGVFVFSTDITKKDTISKLKKILEIHNKINKRNDQLSLNILFYKKWIELPLIFNWYYHHIGFSTILNKKNSNTKSITVHFTGNMKPWNPNCPFYKEWKNNLEKADLINIGKPQEPRKKFTKKEIEKYSKILKRKNFLYAPIWTIDKILGVIGIFLKKHFPRLYFELKK
ncbi:hypothetical protein KJ841_00830 [Patescibacteria group bacterium]|nr:hypothetical protein [Patescibacteria group bacterium]